jgi:hypothetical protein
LDIYSVIRIILAFEINGGSCWLMRGMHKDLGITDRTLHQDGVRWGVKYYFAVVSIGNSFQTGENKFFNESGTAISS